MPQLSTARIMSFGSVRMRMLAEAVMDIGVFGEDDWDGKTFGDFLF